MEIRLERPWRRETMHNLVKEATGIDFHGLGNDLQAAKEVTLRDLGIDLDNKDKSSIEACPSVGQLLNEVSQHHMHIGNNHQVFPQIYLVDLFLPLIFVISDFLFHETAIPPI